jgi:hypothetical protein
MQRKLPNHHGSVRRDPLLHSLFPIIYDRTAKKRNAVTTYIVHTTTRNRQQQDIQNQQQIITRGNTAIRTAAFYHFTFYLLDTNFDEFSTILYLVRPYTFFKQL